MSGRDKSVDRYDGPLRTAAEATIDCRILLVRGKIDTSAETSGEN
jgi:hypothetical protein